MKIVKFECPGCGQPLEADEEPANEGVTCPTCHIGFVPDAGAKSNIWTKHIATADQVNALGVWCLVVGPIFFFIAMAIQSGQDSSDWNAMVLCVTGLATIWGLAKTVSTYWGWSLAVGAIVAGALIMGIGWIFAQSLIAVVAGGFIMLAGVICKKA